MMDNLLDLVKKILHSPTYSTWVNLASRYAIFLVVTPFLLTRFSTNEIALWYLFNTVIAFSGMFDVGFAQTLIRYSSFLKAGAQTVDDLLQHKSAKDSGIREATTNWRFFREVLFVYRHIYLLLTVVAAFVLVFPVTWLVRNTIFQSGFVADNFLAWGFTLLGVSFSLYGKQYDSVLRGMNFIPLINWWETGFNILLGLGYLVVLVISPRLLYLVIVLQLVSVALPLQKKRLIARYIPQLNYHSEDRFTFDKNIFMACWQPTWKTGIMMSGTQGVNYFASIILSNFVPSNVLASYLFSQRILQICNRFSWAPFYSKIPVFNELRARKDILRLRRYTLSNLNKSLFVLIFLTFVAGILVSRLLGIINANAQFVSSGLWVLMVGSIFFDRVQAMHGQIYMTTNDVRFYITALLSGGLYLLVLFVLISHFGAFAPPLAFLIANLAVNVWYNMKHSLFSLHLSFRKYLTTFLYKPVLAFMVSTIVTVWASN